MDFPTRGVLQTPRVFIFAGFVESCEVSYERDVSFLQALRRV